MPSAPPKRIVIVGGGFAGIHCALALKNADAQVTLIDRRNFHLFQPLLYQVATGGLSPANIAAPLRGILSGQSNTRVILGDVIDIDTERNELLLDGHDEVFNRVGFDTLVVSTGASHSYFGNDHWQQAAPGLKSIEDATILRQRLLSIFEAAEYAAWRGASHGQILSMMTFLIVGGGPTGVELAGALGEIVRDTFKQNFRSIDPTDARICLVEAGDRILPAFDPSLSQRAAQALHELGVEVRCRTRVTDVQEHQATLEFDDASEVMTARSIIWAAGVRASPLGEVISKRTGASTDRAGRVMVEPDLSIANYPHVFVLGDLSHFAHTHKAQPLPGVAAVAMQQGRYLGKLLSSRLRGGPSRPFVYTDYGSMATIGRGRAVAEMGKLRFSGFVAWVAWLFVHVLKLVGFQNKFLVCMQWAWCYATHDRGARLITASQRTSLKAIRQEVAKTRHRLHRAERPRLQRKHTS